MKYHVLHDFITSTPFEEKSSDHFKDIYKLKLLTNFDISLTSFLGGVMNLWLTHNLELLLEMTSYRHQTLSGASVYEYL